MRKNIKYKMYGLFLILPFFIMASKLGGVDDIVKTIKTGNAKELSQYFDNMIEMKILDSEGTYSRAQAAQVIKDFFAKNTVQDFQLKHDGASGGNNMQYIIGTLTTTSGKYRTYIYLKKKGDTFVIQELSIENE